MRTALVGRPCRQGEADVTIVSHFSEARRLRSQYPSCVVMVADARLPLRDGVLFAIRDERAHDAAAVEESARVLRAGGRLVVLAASGHGGPGSILGGVLGWKRRRAFVRRQDFCAWFLSAGFGEISQHETDRPVHTIRTEGVVRKLPREMPTDVVKL